MNQLKFTWNDKNNNNNYYIFLRAFYLFKSIPNKWRRKTDFNFIGYFFFVWKNENPIFNEFSRMFLHWFDSKNIEIVFFFCSYIQSKDLSTWYSQNHGNNSIIIIAYRQNRQKLGKTDCRHLMALLRTVVPFWSSLTHLLTSDQLKISFDCIDLYNRQI